MTFTELEIVLFIALAAVLWLNMRLQRKVQEHGNHLHYIIVTLRGVASGELTASINKDNDLVVERSKK